MSKIQDALNSFGGNFARPTKFNVMVSMPGLLGGNTPAVVDILCKSVSMPEIQQSTIEMSFKGHKLTYPGRVNQAQSVSMTFYVDEGYQIYDIFKRWIDIMDNKYYGHANATETSVSEKYGDMTLIAVDYKETTDVKTSLFEGVFPVSISDMSYDATNKDSVQEYTVQFAYFRVTDDVSVLMNFASESIGRVSMSDSIMRDIQNLRPAGSRTDTASPVKATLAQYEGEVNAER